MMRQVPGCNVRTQLFAAIALMFLLGVARQAVAAERAPGKEPVRLPLTFVRSNPVTTITVGDRAVQAIVDTGGDGAVTLSKAVIDSVRGVRLSGTLVTTNSYGRGLRKPRYRIPVVHVGGHTFRDMAVVQAPAWPPGQSPPVPNGIGRQFLSHYFVVVDFPHHSITLRTPGAKNTSIKSCGRTWIPMEHTDDKELAVGDFQTQSGRVRLLFDTGATGSMLPQITAEKLQLPTFSRDPGPARFYESTTLSAAGHDFGPLEFVVLPLKLPGDFQGMLGRNFFMHHVVCLDYRLRRVFIR